jgi:hypothetical protein
MHAQRSYYLRTLILGVTAALASCLLALALTTQPAQAATQPYDLSISQTASPASLSEPGNVTYTLTVKHELVDGCGNCYPPGYDIRVTDTLPSGVDVVAVNPASDRISCTITSNVTCTINYLYDGESVNADIEVRPTTAGAQTLTNIAEVSHGNYYGSSYYNSPDPNTANNTSTATTEVSESYTPIPDTTPPETTLTQKPQALSGDASPRFSFTANEGPPTFECKLDTSAFQPCTSPKQYFMLSEGEHTFQVRAIDPSGNVDPTPTEAYTWMVDSIGPKVTFTEKPDAVTSDTTPTWAWTVEDANLEPTATFCTLYDITNERNLFIQNEYEYYDPNFGGCASPFTFGGDLPDGDYYFKILARDKLGNARTAYNYFEVDTVAPQFVSGKPTGTLVGRSANVVATFDEDVYSSAKYVNIYRKGSATPLGVSRSTYGKQIKLDPNNSLRSDTWYTVEVTTGVNDGANNLQTPTTWTFKTK